MQDNEKGLDIDNKNEPSGEENVVSKEVAATGKKSVAAEEKTESRKKLPALFKKTYTQRALKNKILNKLYIAGDKQSVSDLFVQGGNPKRPERFAVPLESKFTKTEIKRYVSLAKEIKKQKMTLKLVPLAVVVALIAALVIAVQTFKNPLLKKLIRSGCESAFGAKTDIGYVDLSILSTRVTIGNLAVGNKNSFYKNLFEVGKIQLDFNFVQLLRGNFVAQNLEASDMAFNTDRSTSCELVKKQKAPKKEPAEESAFSKNVKSRLNSAADSLKYQAADLLGGSDVDSIVANIKSNIKSPEAVQNALETTQSIVDKWKAKPDELELTVNEFAQSVKNLQTIKVNRNMSLEELQDALVKINAAIEQGKSIKNTSQTLVDEVKTDGQRVKEISQSVTDAVESDYDFAKERLTTITGAIKNADSLMATAINTVGYSLMGKYYPYAMKAISTAKTLKAKADEINAKKAPKTPKKQHKRLKGTTFWYGATYPSFLIQRIYASGTGFKAEITELTNDQDVRNIPLKFNGSFDYSNINHSASIVVDTRKKSSEPLVSVSYTGSGFTASIDGSSIVAKSGIPSIDGRAVLSLKGTVVENGFNADGSVVLNPVSLTTDGFPNEFVTKYYRQGLEAIDSLSFGYDMGYAKDSGVFFNVNGNYAQQFANALKTVIMNIGRDAKNAALERIQKELNDSSNTVVAKAKEFLGIENDIDIQNMRVSDIQQILEKRKQEIMKQLKGVAEQKVSEVKEAAKEAASEAAKEATKKAQDAISDEIQNVMGDKSEEATDALKNAAGSLLKGLGGKKK